mgnify:CR=1 FL=1
MPRKYTKKSDYWKKFNSAASGSGIEDLLNNGEKVKEVLPDSPGEPYYESSVASSRAQESSGGQSTNFRRMRRRISANNSSIVISPKEVCLISTEVVI